MGADRRRIDGFVQSADGRLIRGISEGLRKRQACGWSSNRPNRRYFGRRKGRTRSTAWRGYRIPLWHDDIADAIDHVSTDEAVAMTKRLAREEGLFFGTSTGANVIAALRLAEGLPADATVVTIACDTGMKYLRSLGVENGSSRSTQG